MLNVVIIDYGMGNLRSVYNKVQRLGVSCSLSADPKTIRQAHGLILPGVGHFGKAMDRLRQLDLLELLHDRVTGEQVPVMGICLGMQLFMEHSEEGNAEGLAWIRGNAIRFRPTEAALKVPHIGWNSVEPAGPHRVLDGLGPNELFYFVHSYHVELVDPSDALHYTHYGYPFVSALARDNIVGFQYHPEKSHDAGITLFQNFLSLVRSPANV